MSARVATPGRPLRLLALGYQGWGNLGDEAILTGIETLLVGRGVTVGAVVSGPHAERIVAFPSASRVVAWRLLPTGSCVVALRRSDGLLLAGGGLIHDHWASILPRYLAWIVLARLLGKPVVWLAVGVGPLRGGAHRLLARLACRLTTLALVRDRRSAELLGGVGRRVRVVPDAALFNPPPDDPAPAAGDELPIIVRGPTPGHGPRADWLAARLMAVAATARERGWRPVLLTMAGRADAPIVDAIRSRAHTMSGAEVQIDALGPTPAAVIERLAGRRAAVSIRLHGVLLAAVAGVPAVAMVYDDKVRAAAVELGLGDLAVDLHEVDPADVLERVACAADPARHAALASAVAAVRARRLEVAELVERAFGGMA